MATAAAMTQPARNDLILADLIALRAAALPDRDVLTFVSVGPGGTLCDEVRSYAQLWNNANRLAAGLAADGAVDGVRFAIMMRNHPAFVEAMVASSIAGTVFVPIDPRAAGDRLAFMLRHAGCEGVVVGDYALDAVLAVRAQVPQLRWVWVLRTGARDALPDGVCDLSAVMTAGRPDIAGRVTDPDQAQQLLFTSGTTGEPKAIIAPYRRMGEAARLGGLFGLTQADRPYTGLSLTHANAQMVTLANALHDGLRAVISDRFTKTRLLDIARRYGCTVFTVLGGMTTALFAEKRRPDDADTPLRLVISAGMPAALWEDFARRFGVEVFEFYGAAEGGLCINPPGFGPVGSVGRAPPTLVLKIVSEDGRQCAPGEAGEICFRAAMGDPLRVEYLNDPSASRQKVTEGWLRMGDIGHVDAQGWLFFHHRKGSAIRRNGDFISPPEVEKALAEHPLIADAFVYGVPAASGAPGEKDVVAAIVADSEMPFDPEAVFAHCRRLLPANSVPSILQLVQQIPKTASEKPLERVLAADIAAGRGTFYYPETSQRAAGEKLRA